MHRSVTEYPIKKIKKITQYLILVTYPFLGGATDVYVFLATESIAEITRPYDYLFLLQK